MVGCSSVQREVPENVCGRWGPCSVPRPSAASTIQATAVLHFSQASFITRFTHDTTNTPVTVIDAGRHEKVINGEWKLLTLKLTRTYFTIAIIGAW